MVGALDDDDDDQDDMGLLVAGHWDMKASITLGFSFCSLCLLVNRDVQHRFMVSIGQTSSPLMS